MNIATSCNTLGSFFGGCRCLSKALGFVMLIMTPSKCAALVHYMMLPSFQFLSLPERHWTALGRERAQTLYRVVMEWDTGVQVQCREISGGEKGGVCAATMGGHAVLFHGTRSCK